MKTKKRVHYPRTVSFDWQDVGELVVNALADLGSLFRVRDINSGPYALREERAFHMMTGLVLCSLANIERVSPMFDATVQYCEREGIDLNEYLESQIRMKFRRKLHKKSLHKS